MGWQLTQNEYASNTQPNINRDINVENKPTSLSICEKNMKPDIALFGAFGSFFFFCFFFFEPSSSPSLDFFLEEDALEAEGSFFVSFLAGFWKWPFSWFENNKDFKGNLHKHNANNKNKMPCLFLPSTFTSIRFLFPRIISRGTFIILVDNKIFILEKSPSRHTWVD